MRHLLWFCILVTGCASFNGLQPRCETADEKAMGETYSSNGMPVGNFERFVNQCEKYGYRVPSMEKFLASYNERNAGACMSAQAYFKYVVSNSGGRLHQCDGQNIQFDRDTVKDDALQARFLRRNIQELDSKLDKADRENGKKEYDRGFLADLLLRAAYESNPAKLQETRSKKSAELSVIAQKYGSIHLKSEESE